MMFRSVYLTLGLLALFAAMTHASPAFGRFGYRRFPGRHRRTELCYRIYQGPNYLFSCARARAYCESLGAGAKLAGINSSNQYALTQAMGPDPLLIDSWNGDCYNASTAFADAQCLLMSSNGHIESDDPANATDAAVGGFGFICSHPCDMPIRAEVGGGDMSTTNNVAVGGGATAAGGLAVPCIASSSASILQPATYYTSFTIATSLETLAPPLETLTPISTLAPISPAGADACAPLTTISSPACPALSVSPAASEVPIESSAESSIVMATEIVSSVLPTASETIVESSPAPPAAETETVTISSPAPPATETETETVTVSSPAPPVSETETSTASEVPVTATVIESSETLVSSTSESIPDVTVTQTVTETATSETLPPIETTSTPIETVTSTVITSSEVTVPPMTTVTSVITSVIVSSSLTTLTDVQSSVSLSTMVSCVTSVSSVTYYTTVYSPIVVASSYVALETVTKTLVIGEGESVPSTYTGSCTCSLSLTESTPSTVVLPSSSVSLPDLSSIASIVDSPVPSIAPLPPIIAPVA